MRKTKAPVQKKKRLIFLGIGLALFFGILFAAGRLLIPNKSQQPDSDTSQVTIIAPQPFAFQELTIPYLRRQSYKSNLGELSVLSESNWYTSNLTSYASDGLKVNGLLMQPKGDRPEQGWPAIVFVHGYIPPKSYKTTEKYVDYVNYLARQGYVVFKIDLRGHGSSEGEAGGAYYSSDYVVDVLNARAALQASGLVNPNKVGLWGHSMAGNVVLRAMAVKPEIPATVVWAGAGYTYTDLRQWGIEDNSYHPPADNSNRQRRRQELVEKYGNPVANSQFWQQVAATNYLADFKGAIQQHHATNDPVVDIGYSRNLNQLLDQTTIPHELYEYPTGGHNLNGPSFTLAMRRTVEFFREHLN